MCNLPNVPALRPAGVCLPPRADLHRAEVDSRKSGFLSTAIRCRARCSVHTHRGREAVLTLTRRGKRGYLFRRVFHVCPRVFAAGAPLPGESSPLVPPTANGETESPAVAMQKNNEPDPSRTRVIYIMGAGRSGSTVLDTVLGNHPDIVSVGELANLHRFGWTNGEYCACGLRGNTCGFWSAVRGQWEDISKPVGVSEYLSLQDRYEIFHHLGYGQ